MRKYDSRIVLDKRSKESHGHFTDVELIEIELYKDSVVWEIYIELRGEFSGSMTVDFYEKEEAESAFDNICKHYNLDDK